MNGTLQFELTSPLLLRMLAAMEAITGLLYVAVLIARLGAIQATPKPDET